MLFHIIKYAGGIAQLANTEISLPKNLWLIFLNLPKQYDLVTSLLLDFLRHIAVQYPVPIMNRSFTFHNVLVRGIWRHGHVH